MYSVAARLSREIIHGHGFPHVCAIDRLVRERERLWEEEETVGNNNLAGQRINKYAATCLRVMQCREGTAYI